MRVLGTLLVGLSWIVLLISGIGALTGGWLYYGYSRIACHPMFARPELNCDTLTVWAAEHILIAGRLVLPYRQLLTQKQDLLLYAAAFAFVTALLILVIHRIVRRRRKDMW